MLAKWVTVCRRIEQRFASRPESVGAVRRLLASTLQGWGLDDSDVGRAATQAILLVASELSTNSVAATSEDFGVAMTVHRGYAEISVEDRAPEDAKLASAGPDESTGRGLTIVAALSDRWGQEPFDGFHKRVWSQVPLPPGLAVAGDCRL